MKANCPGGSSSAFFQFPWEYEKLKKEIFPDLIAKCHGLKIWVCPCSSGEWAFSIAIIAKEIMREYNTSFPCQIIGTDVDPERIEFAKKGEYGRNIFLLTKSALSEVTGGVTKEQLKFFKRTKNGYRVKPEIRNMVEFYTHDVIEDPPITEINFLSNRWLLQWFDLEIQKKIIGIFQSAIVPGGVLFMNGRDYYRKQQ